MIQQLQHLIVSEWVEVYVFTSHSTHNRTFQTITCTGTDNSKQTGEKRRWWWQVAIRDQFLIQNSNVLANFYYVCSITMYREEKWCAALCFRRWNWQNHRNANDGKLHQNTEKQDIAFYIHLLGYGWITVKQYIFTASQFHDFQTWKLSYILTWHFPSVLIVFTMQMKFW